MFTGTRESRFIFLKDSGLKQSVTTAISLLVLLKWNLNSMYGKFTTAGYKG